MGEEPSALSALDEPYREYWAELGRFVHEFSIVEALLQNTLRMIADLPAELAGALFGDIRLSVTKDTINRVLAMRGDAEGIARLKRPLDQLGIINGTRNDILHWGATFDAEGAFLVTNARLHVIPDKLKEYRVSVHDLRAMQTDVFAIKMHLVLEIQRRGGVLSADVQSEWEAELEQPWLYKPPQQRPRPPSAKSGRGKGP